MSTELDMSTALDGPLGWWWTALGYGLGVAVGLGAAWAYLHRGGLL